MRLLAHEIGQTVGEAAASGDATLHRHAAQLEHAWRDLEQTTGVLGDALGNNPNLALANASIYLDAFGHTLIAWMWLRQAVTALPHADGGEAPFYRAKLAAARYFFAYELPKTAPQHRLLRSLEPLLVELDDACL
jgi:hypothetical protein